MKRTQFKDAVRNIWKQKVSYFSVIIIALLGVSTFLGMNYSDGALRKNGSAMYNAVNFRDIEIISTALFTEEDLEAILNTEGVVDAEAVLQTGAKVGVGENRQNVNVITVTQRVNLPTLIEGRLPETAGECSVEERFAKEMDWHVGDEVQMLNAKGETAQYLTDGRFVIVGIANHPDHTSVSIPETLYVMVTRDAFDQKALDGCFMKAEIVVEKPAGINRFDARYENAVNEVSTRLEQVAEQRAPIRDSQIKSQIQSKMDEAQSELDSALEKLRQVRAELDEGWTALSDGETQIDEKEAELTDAQSQLEATWEKLQSAARMLAEGEAKLADARSKLGKGRKMLKEGREKLDTAKEELIKGWNQLEDAKEQVRSALRSRLGSAAGYVDWASKRSVDIDDPNEDATDFWVTTSHKFNLNKSLKQNVKSLIYSGAIPDKALIALYRHLTGE